jgi:ABC-type sugar transport system ATPase subunit
MLSHRTVPGGRRSIWNFFALTPAFPRGGGSVALMWADRASARNVDRRAAGEAHAIIGENGAGKSTLTKILSSRLAPTRGAIKLDGSPIELKRRGMVVVHQEIMVAPDLSIAETMFLGRELRRGLTVDDREMNRRALEAMRVFGVEATVTV